MGCAPVWPTHRESDPGWAPIHIELLIAQIGNELAAHQLYLAAAICAKSEVVEEIIARALAEAR